MTKFIRRAGRHLVAVRGAGRVMDIRGDKRRPTVATTTDEALAGDWRAVGGDVRVAMQHHVTRT